MRLLELKLAWAQTLGRRTLARASAQERARARRARFERSPCASSSAAERVARAMDAARGALDHNMQSYLDAVQYVAMKRLNGLDAEGGGRMSPR